RRGIAPAILLEQVRITAPFIFSTPYPDEPGFAYLRRLQAYDGEELDHLSYFQLCLCAHWATAGTYVPTDVDNAIRMKLWLMDEAAQAFSAMGDLVLQALRWDYRPVTARLAHCGADFVST